MTIDERQLTEVLHGIDARPVPGLADRARRGGQRRLYRNRSLMATGALAVGGAAVPTCAALRASHETTRLINSSSNGDHNDNSLYAQPPVSSRVCNEGYTSTSSDVGHGLAVTYQDLLLLPSGPIDSALVRQDKADCDSPHVALTATTGHGTTIDQGVVVEGPNAPTAAEDYRVGPSIDFGGETGHVSIDGQDATEFTLSGGVTTTDAFWTEPDGGQWEASVRGMSQADAVALLNQVQLDSHAGTATLSNAAGNDWTVAPAARDIPNPHGFVISQWTDADGHGVDMTVTQSPDRTMQRVAVSPVDETYVTVRGQQGVLGDGKDGGLMLTWQEAPDVQVQLMVANSTPAEIEQVAAGLSLAAPDDPRINSD